jgi:hypothetical protein
MGRRWLSLAVVLVGCSVQPRAGIGTQCELNTECAAPLVCRLGHCRRECRTSRDCVGTAQCVAAPGGFGVCQLPEETRCALPTDCPAPLVCRAMRCVNECALEGSARDCPPGAVCRAVEGGLGCVEEPAPGCTRDGDCGEGRFCAPDGVCRAQCVTDRDCALDTACVDGRCLRRGDGGVAPDAGDGGGQRRCPAPADPVDLSAGLDHACVVRASGAVDCWGGNLAGQLGRGSTSSAEPMPARVPGLGGAVQVEAGHFFTCARTGEPGVQCFGANSSGQLGDGTTTDRASPAPVQLDPADDPLAPLDLGLGASHACLARGVGGALDRAARCWGLGTSGQFGRGTTGARTRPVTGVFDYNPVALAAGDAHTCALDMLGGVVCYGADTDGALGEGGTIDGTADDAVQVVAAGARGCYRRADGAVYCWGRNDFGQIGDGTTDPSRVRRPVDGLRAVDVAVDGDTTCAVRADCTVWCWGANSGGVLFGPAHAALAQSAVPVDVGVTDAARVVLGGGFACVLTTDGRVRCWGDDRRGQLGRGTTGTPDASPAPVQLPPL